MGNRNICRSTGRQLFCGVPPEFFIYRFIKVGDPPHKLSRHPACFENTGLKRVVKLQRVFFQLKYPLQLILREILIQNNTALMSGGTGMEDQYSIGETIKHAIIVVSTVPILLIYPFLQRYFVKGVMIGAVKG